jgi:hypothetical protein
MTESKKQEGADLSLFYHFHQWGYPLKTGQLIPSDGLRGAVD